MRVVAIINPVSGAGMDPTVAGRRVALLREVLTRRQIDHDIHLTERAGHARDLARAAAQAHADLVITWGGDGTLNEVGSALAGTATAVGLIPAGSGNGFAAAIGVPREPSAALDKALDGRSRRVDVASIAGRRFLNVAGIGVDARIAILFNQRARGSRGRWPYVAIGLAQGCRYAGRRYALELDGDRLETRALLIAFANGREYGMGAVLAPDAELDDGLLNAYVVEDRSVLRRFWDARHLAAGTVARAGGVIVRKVRHAVVDAAEPIEFHVDGEPGCLEGPLELGVMPRALIVRV